MHDTKVTLKKVDENYYEAYYEGKQILGGRKDDLIRMMKIMVRGILEAEKSK